MKNGQVKRTLWRCAVIVSLLIVLNAWLTGCTQERVESIQILEGSFSEQYSLDAKLDLKNAKILVGTTKGSRTEPISEDMVTGFDTSKVGERMLTVTYGGKTASFRYRVTYILPVHSSARISASLSGQTLTVRMDRLDLPVYGVSFTVSVDQGGVPEVQPHQNFGLVSKPFRPAGSNKIYIAMVGTSPVEKDGVIATIRGNISEVSIENVLFSDGQQDYILPDFHLNG